MTEKQRLIGMEVSNFLKVGLLELKFDENERLIIISGNNGEGKTSALKAVEAALGGGNSIPSEPLKKGKARGYVVLETDDYIIKRTFTQSNTQLVVEAKDGGAISKPQQLLTSLIGSISFDPLEFSQMKSKDQLAALQTLLNLDFTELDANYDKVFQDRRDLKRDLKAAEAQLGGIENYGAVPKAVVASGTIVKKLENAQAEHAAASDLAEGVENLQKEQLAAEQELANSKSRAEELQRELKTVQAFMKTTKEDIESLQKKKIPEAQKELEAAEKNLPDLEAIKKELSEVDELNDKIRSNIKRKEIRENVDKLQAAVDAKGEALEGIKKEKQAALEAARFPVDGLSLDETGVRFNDIPFQQCSQAEKLRISTAMGMAENPALPLMLIRDGSLLDEKNMQLMAELAEKYDCQILLEYAGEHKGAKVVLCNGEAV